MVLGNWDWRYTEIELTALVEANRIVAIAEYEGAKFVNPIDPQLLHKFDMDVRISMAWDTSMLTKQPKPLSHYICRHSDLIRLCFFF